MKGSTFYGSPLKNKALDDAKARDINFERGQKMSASIKAEGEEIHRSRAGKNLVQKIFTKKPKKSKYDAAHDV